MGSKEKFCLRWNDFESNISCAFRELREEKDFFDVTLACDDSQIQAHKVILSACSPFFRKVLRRNPHQHPLLYLKGVKYNELLSVLNFMYLGEVNVAQEELNSFLAVAEDLRVKGLTQGGTSKPDQPKQPAPRVKDPTSVPESNPVPSQAKRPRPIQSAQNSVLGLAHHQAFNPLEDDDIQEVVPVKTEPREHPVASQSPHLSQVQLQAPSQYQDHSMQDQEPAAGGTIALDESYGDESYDYGQYEGYEDGAGQMDSSLGMVLPSVGADGSKDLESIILSKMAKNADGDWQCTDCFKVSKVKTNIFEHIEANHVESPGYQCELCYKFCRTRNALRNHKNFKHKQIKNDSLLLRVTSAPTLSGGPFLGQLAMEKNFYS
eukprot:GFUD01033257.1.p1 GENE.GFUD01033257.1~~GFUD01033257.1.p1  ORF type:complete len:384 (+),score=84.19 GFUD01033257.1:22-1152(+)